MRPKVDRMAFTLIQHLYKTENEGKGGRIKKKNELYVAV